MTSKAKHIKTEKSDFIKKILIYLNNTAKCKQTKKKERKSLGEYLQYSGRQMVNLLTT